VSNKTSIEKCAKLVLMPSHVQPRRIIINGHPTSVRLEPAFWYWLRIIAAECGMTAKKFIECIRIAYPHDPLSSTLRVQITNYFYSQSPRTGFVDPESKFAFRIERPRKSRKRKQSP
jgi:predicted DNA-binding ribbon-helix-helix protein